MIRNAARTIVFFAVPILCACTSSKPTTSRGPTPLAAYHQHLLSPAVGELWGMPERLDAKDLILQLDEAGIRRAVVLSVAYAYGDDRRQVESELDKVRAENDWTAAQVARWPQRLVGFCSVSPLKDYAIAELERCSQRPNMIGLKLHLGNSGVELRKPEHVGKLGAIFEAAETLKLPIVIHMKTRTGLPYGREDAAILLDKIISRAPNTLVQIAHMAGAGPGYQDFVDEAIAVFVEAIRTRDPHTRNLFFDVASVATHETTPQNGELIARRIRELGVHRILFGTDLTIRGNPPPDESWKIFQAKVPLTAAELRTIAANVPPYMRM